LGRRIKKVKAVRSNPYSLQRVEKLVFDTLADVEKVR